MGVKTKPPAAPNATQSVQAQTGLEQNTAAYNAALNRYNVNSPYGSQTWQQNGTDPNTGAPIYQQNISLNPNAQQALTNTQATQAGLSGLQRQALGGVANTLSGNPFDQSKLPAAPINAGTTAQQAIMHRLQPTIDLQNKQFEADMANKGIPMGSDAYNASRLPIMQQQNDQYSQAALYGINADQQARQQAIDQQGYYANAPVNYLNALMNGSQVQTPQFQGTPSIMTSAPNYLSALNTGYQGQLNAYNAQTGAQNSMMGGLFGLGSALLSNPSMTSAIAKWF